MRELAPEVFAFSGWFLALALGLVLVQLTQQWRTSFRNREWVLMPSSESQKQLWGLQRVAETIAVGNESVQQALLGTTESVRSEVQASEASRKEFAVLREELERRSSELEAARVGVDLWHRRAVLRAISRAVEMIRDDRERERDVRSTLDGLLVELEDCLQENRISLHFPEVGAPLDGDSTIDLARVVREPSPDELRRGTIAAVERPAYVALRLDGKQEVLLAARVKVFV